MNLIHVSYFCTQTPAQQTSGIFMTPNKIHSGRVLIRALIISRVNSNCPQVCGPTWRIKPGMQTGSSYHCVALFSQVPKSCHPQPLPVERCTDTFSEYTIPTADEISYLFDEGNDIMVGQIRDVLLVYTDDLIPFHYPSLLGCTSCVLQITFNMKALKDWSSHTD